MAVEPSGYARSILRPALWGRRVRNAVVLAAALGPEPGVAVLRTPRKRRGAMGYGTANLAPGAADPRPQVAEAVAVLTLDAVADALGLGRIDLIKADIEGFEPGMLAGARGVLARHRPAMLLEMDDSRLRRAGHTLAGFWAELDALGYLPHRLEEGRLVPWPGSPADGDVVWLPAA